MLVGQADGRTERGGGMVTYREMAVEVVKLVGRELSLRADELVPDVNYCKEMSILVRIPSISDDLDAAPEIEVNATVYPTRKTLATLGMIREMVDRKGVP